MTRISRWTAEVASADAYELGEGPVWGPIRRRFIWIGINSGTVDQDCLDGQVVEAAP